MTPGEAQTPTCKPRLSRGGTRRRRMFTPGEIELLLLHLMQSGPRHGYDLSAEIERRSGAAYAPSSGVIYPALQKLVQEGSTTDVSDERSRRRAYVITDQGLERLGKDESGARLILDRLDRARAPSSLARGDQLRGALARLEAEVGAGACALSPELEAQVAARLDEIVLLIRRTSRIVTLGRSQP